MTPALRRRWCETRREADEWAARVGGRVGSAVVVARPDAGKPYYVDWIDHAGQHTECEWKPKHAFSESK